MPVSLPTSTYVRKAREQAAHNVSQRAEVARTPLLAVLGAGDYAVARVGEAVNRAAELPQRLTSQGLRTLVTDLRVDAEETYSGFAERGEKTWGRIRKQPQVKKAISTIETYTDKFDARVDDLVDDAHDAGEKALRTVTRQTRWVAREDRSRDPALRRRDRRDRRRRGRGRLRQGRGGRAERRLLDQRDRRRGGRHRAQRQPQGRRPHRAEDGHPQARRPSHLHEGRLEDHQLILGLLARTTRRPRRLNGLRGRCAVRRSRVL